MLRAYCLLLAACGVTYVQNPATITAPRGAEVQLGDKVCWTEPRWLGTNNSCAGYGPVSRGLPRCRMSSAREKDKFWAGPGGWAPSYELDPALTAEQRKNDPRICCYTCSERQLWYR